MQGISKSALLAGAAAAVLFCNSTDAQPLAQDQTATPPVQGDTSASAVQGIANPPAEPSATGSTIAQPGETPQASGADEGDIVVTGIRNSLRSAVEQKRSSAQIVDAVTAEDIGKFPTENVADATQRITGVQITRTRGAGTAASVRGLPPAFTRVQLNNSTLASALVDLQGGGAGGNITRSFDFRTVPTDFVRTLEVTKSPTADMQEGGLSGTVNVRTVRPLDLGKTTVTAGAFGVLNSNSGKTTPRLSALASTVLLDGRLGLLITGGYDQTRTETHNNGLDGFNTQREAATGVDYNRDGDRLDTFNIPSQVRTEIFRENRKRTTAAAIVEFKASSAVKLYAEGFFSRFDIRVDDYQNLHIFSTANGAVFDPSTTTFTTIGGISPTQLTAGSPFATTLGLSGVDVRGLNRINNSLARNYYGKTGVDLNAGAWTGDLSASYSRSRQVGDNLGLAQISRFDVTQACVPGDQVCGITFPAATEARRLDPNQGIVASLNGAFGRETRDRIVEAQGNLRREFDGSVISKIAVGGVASWRKTYANAPTLVVTAAQLAPFVGLTRSTVQPAGFSTSPYVFLVGPSKGSFLGHYNGDLQFPTQWITSDTQAVLDKVSRDQLVSAGALNQNLNAVVNVREEILAGYARVDIGSNGDRATGNIGLRVVRTKATSSGFAPDLSGIRILTDAGGTVTVPAAGPVDAKKSYTAFLPAANAKFDVTDNFLVRFAVSRTLSRPTLTDISPSTVIAGVGANFTITAGNPALNPFLSWNADFSAEWYPNADTALTLALFAKDLSTLVRPVTTSVTLPVTFVTTSTNTSVVRDQIFQRTIPTNQDGVTVKGAEVGFQQVFSFLPGLLSHTGFQANYTFISNSDPQVLTAASKHNFNVSTFYENAGLAVRASYTWRDRFVSAGLPDGFNGLGITTRPRGNLDLNVTYDITPNFTMILEGSNVLNNVDATRTTLGNLPQSYFDVGSQIMAGVRFRM